MPDFLILNFNDPAECTFEIPPAIALCPYCNGNLSAQVTCWDESEEPGLYVAEEIEMTCDKEPDMSDRQEWQAFTNGHSEMPYVYWFPIKSTVETWINSIHRFKGGAQD